MYIKVSLRNHIDSIESLFENLLNPLGIIQSGNDRESGTICKEDYEKYMAQIKEASEKLYELVHDAFEERSEILYKKRSDLLNNL